MDLVSNFLSVIDNYVNFSYFDAINMIETENEVKLLKNGRFILSPFTWIDQYNLQGYQPLHYAIHRRNPLACDWILSEPDVKINAITEIEQWNPAHMAVRIEDSNLLIKLIELGVNMNALDAKRLTPLTYTETDLDALRWIHMTPLNFKISLGSLGRNYFHYFAKDSTPVLLDYVIDSAKELMDKPDRTGTTALMLAAENGQINSLQRLLNSDALFDLADSDGRTALHRAAAAGQLRSCELLLFLKDEISDEDNEAFAYIEDEREIAKRLKAQTLLSLPDKNGFTPLMSAVLAGHIDIVALLAKTNSELLNLRNEEANGDTALHYAVMTNSPKMVEVLLDAGAIVDSVNKDGKKPSDLVADEFKKDFVDLLILSC